MRSYLFILVALLLFVAPVFASTELLTNGNFSQFQSDSSNGRLNPNNYDIPVDWYLGQGSFTSPADSFDWVANINDTVYKGNRILLFDGNVDVYDVFAFIPNASIGIYNFTFYYSVDSPSSVHIVYTPLEYCYINGTTIENETNVDGCTLTDVHRYVVFDGTEWRKFVYEFNITSVGDKAIAFEGATDSQLRIDNVSLTFTSTVPPNFSNLTVSPPQTQPTNNTNVTVQFNVSVISENTIDKVILYTNGVPHEASNISSIYTVSTQVFLGNTTYYWFSNDTIGNSNTTGNFTYELLKDKWIILNVAHPQNDTYNTTLIHVIGDATGSGTLIFWSFFADNLTPVTPFVLANPLTFDYFPYDISNLSNGNHTFHMEFRDSVGSFAEKNTTFFLNVTAPSPSTPSTVSAGTLLMLGILLTVIIAGVILFIVVSLSSTELTKEKVVAIFVVVLIAVALIGVLAQIIATM